MPSPRLFLSFIAATAFLAIEGCQSQSDAPQKLPPPKSTITLTLKREQRSVLANIPVGSALEIILPEPMQGPPYAWDVITNNARVLEQTSRILEDPQGYGKPSTYSVTFQSLRQSQSRSIVTIAAIRPGAKESDPDDIFQVTVGVKPAQ